MTTLPAKGADGATYQLALPSLGSTPASGALSVIPSPDGTHAKTADITALSTAITGAIAATQTVSVTGTAAVTQSGAWTIALAPNATVALAGGNTVALKVDGSAVTQPVSLAGAIAVTGPATDAQMRATPIPITGSVTVSDGAGPLTVDGNVAISNFPATQAVSGTVAVSTALALDATVTARLGTLGQKTAAASTPVVIASDQGAVAVAPAAGESHLGSVGSDSKRVVGVPTLTAQTYAAGKCLGGLVTLASFFRLAGKSATLQSATLHLKVANTAAIDLVIFRDAPSVTTGLVDNATFAVDPADFDKVSKVISFTAWNSLGTPSLSRVDGIGSLLSAASGADLRIILVARGSVTIAGVNDAAVALGNYQD